MVAGLLQGNCREGPDALMPIYNVHHVTTYRYAQPVAFGEHRMMLRPLDGHDQRLVSAELTMVPRPTSLRSGRDALGNPFAVAQFSRRAATLSFDSLVRVATTESHPDAFDLPEAARRLPLSLPADELSDLAPFLERCRPDRAVDGWARTVLEGLGAKSTLDCLAGMARAIRGGFTYVRRTERGTQDPGETLERRAGTCRDFAVLMMDAVRSVGLPARFASGYLYVPSRDRQDVRGGGATHAWLQVYVPGPGWIDSDPTNGNLGNAGLVRVAVTRGPDAAIPLSGSFVGFRSDDLGMQVTVKVTREAAGDGQIEAGVSMSLSA